MAWWHPYSKTRINFDLDKGLGALFGISNDENMAIWKIRFFTVDARIVVFFFNILIFCEMTVSTYGQRWVW